MIDQIYSRFPNRSDPRMKGIYSPEKAILAQSLRNENARRLTVFFPPWHGGGPYIDLLVKRLSKLNAVLVFELHDTALEPNVERVVKSFRYIQDSALKSIEKITREHKYDEIRLLSMSLGAVPLAMVAGRLKHFDSATIVAGSSNLATCTWEGIKTRHIRDGFVKRGITEDQLDRAWDVLAPKNYVKYFKNKKVDIFMSANDRLVPTIYQKELVDSLKSAGANLTVSSSMLGHYVTAARFCFFGK